MFPRNARFNKFRYETDNHSPLKEIYIKDLRDYAGKKAVLDILMANSNDIKNRFVRIGLTTKNLVKAERFDINEDEELEWIILDSSDKNFRLDCIGIIRKRKISKKNDKYLANNAKLRLRIFDGPNLIHEALSNIIRDTNGTKKPQFEIVSTPFEAPNVNGGVCIMIIMFNKSLPIYEKELELSNGSVTIQPYNPTETYPCSRVPFNISEFQNIIPSLILKCPLFGMKSKVDNPMIRKLNNSYNNVINDTSLSAINIAFDQNDLKTEDNSNGYVHTEYLNLNPVNKWSDQMIYTNEEDFNWSPLSNNHKDPFTAQIDDNDLMLNTYGFQEDQFIAAIADQNHMQEGSGIMCADNDTLTKVSADVYQYQSKCIDTPYNIDKEDFNWRDPFKGQIEDNDLMLNTNGFQEDKPYIEEVNSQILNTRSAFPSTKEMKDIADVDMEFDKYYSIMQMEDSARNPSQYIQ